MLIRQHFRFDRQLLGLLSASAYAAAREMMHSVADNPRSVPGVVISLQTSGDSTANWHPHCHNVVSNGLFRPDGSFQPLPPLDSQHLMWLFRHKLLRWGKIYPATIEILDCFRHTGFSVYQSPPVLPRDTAAREKLAIYIARAPISLDRLSYDGPHGTVDYQPKSSPSHPLLAAEPSPDHDDTPYRKACRRTWAKLIAKVYLISPRICPKCRFPMKIVWFIEDQAVIRKILQHLGIWETQQRPPPKKIPSSSTVEPIPEECMPRAAEPIYEYDNIDPVYEE